MQKTATIKNSPLFSYLIFIAHRPTNTTQKLAISPTLGNPEIVGKSYIDVLRRPHLYSMSMYLVL